MERVVYNYHCFRNVKTSISGKQQPITGNSQTSKNAEREVREERAGPWRK